MLDQVQPEVKEVLTRLADSKFNRESHKVQEYQSSGVTLNDTNLGDYLSELEDYTNKILIYKGRAKNQENEEIFAKALLLDPQVSLAEMSWLLGFANQSAFTRAFVRWVGEPPRRYQLSIGAKG